MPVIKHYKGVCHVYVHAAADLDVAARDRREREDPAARRVQRARDVARRSRDRRRRSCRALVARLAARVELRGDDTVQRARRRADPRRDRGRLVTPSTSISILAVRVVDGLDAAIAHIERYGSNHTESIVTDDARAAERFVREVDSSTVHGQRVDPVRRRRRARPRRRDRNLDHAPPRLRPDGRRGPHHHQVRRPRHRTGPDVAEKGQTSEHDQSEEERPEAATSRKRAAAAPGDSRPTPAAPTTHRRPRRRDARAGARPRQEGARAGAARRPRSCARSATTSWCCRAAPIARSTRSPTASRSGSSTKGCARSAPRARAPGQWALLDYGDFVVHVFLHSAREHYDLEGLWNDAPRIPIDVPARRAHPGRRAVRSVAACLVKVTVAAIGRLKEPYLVAAEAEYRSGCARTARSRSRGEGRSRAARRAARERPPLRVRRARRARSRAQQFADLLAAEALARRRRAGRVRDRRRRRPHRRRPQAREAS